MGGVNLYINHLLDEDDSGPPSVDYWGVHTLVVDVRRLSDSLVGYTCTPRHLVTRGGVYLSPLSGD